MVTFTKLLSTILFFSMTWAATLFHTLFSRLSLPLLVKVRVRLGWLWRHGERELGNTLVRGWLWLGNTGRWLMLTNGRYLLLVHWGLEEVRRLIRLLLLILVRLVLGATLIGLLVLCLSTSSIGLLRNFLSRWWGSGELCTRLQGHSGPS